MNLQDKIPAYIIEKGNIVRLILFTALFALLFINIYSPFDVKIWFKQASIWQIFLYSSLVILTGVLVVVISRIIMYQLRKKISLNYWHYFLWVVAEVFFMALFYTLIEHLVLKSNRDVYELIKISMRNTALTIFLPYSVMWLYFSYRDNKQKLDNLESSNIIPELNKNMIPFYDEKNEMRFSVKYQDLLYLEASDNYVCIYYLKKEKLSKYMLRNTLKNLEEKLKAAEIIRCHRSYMVNFDKVKILRRGKDGLMLELDHPDAPDLPVSKTHVSKIMDTFSRYSSL